MVLCIVLTYAAQLNVDSGQGYVFWSILLEYSVIRVLSRNVRAFVVERVVAQNDL